MNEIGRFVQIWLVASIFLALILFYWIMTILGFGISESTGHTAWLHPERTVLVLSLGVAFWLLRKRD